MCLSSKVDQIQDIVTGNPTVVKMVVSFNRGARGHNTLRQLLAPVVKDIIEDKTLGINTSPVEVYKAWVNQLETSTGEARYKRKCNELTSQWQMKSEIKGDKNIFLAIIQCYNAGTEGEEVNLAASSVLVYQT